MTKQTQLTGKPNHFNQLAYMPRTKKRGRRAAKPTLNEPVFSYPLALSAGRLEYGSHELLYP